MTRGCYLACGLLAASALASGSAIGQTAAPTAAQGDRTTSPVPGGGQAHGIFITAQEPGQWRGSKLVGLPIYGPDKTSLGDVNEILVDDSGLISAVVIGVGGFLGMGEKNVAVPFSSIDWRATATSTTAVAPHSGNPSGMPASAGDANVGRSSADAMVMQGGIPNHPVLNASKAELQAAPAFAYVGRARTTGTDAPNTSSNRLPPMPAAPAPSR